MKNLFCIIKLNENPVRKSSKLISTVLSYLVISFLLLVFHQVGYSQKVHVELSRQLVQNWLTNQAIHSRSMKSVDPFLLKSDNHNLAYVYDLLPDGYIVVTADQSLTPIIAYSFSSNYRESSQLYNPLEDILTSDLISRFDNLERYPDEIIKLNKQKWLQLLEGKLSHHLFQQWPAEGTTLTGGWVETNFAQSAPYNNFCPMDLVSAARSVAGCPSVAMAMIVDYTNTLNDMQWGASDAYYHNYGGNNYWIDADHEIYDFIPFETLNLYFDSISSKYNDNNEIGTDEKAALIFGCGIAAKQVYSAGGSGTFGVDQAYDAYQRFGFIDSKLVADTDTSFFTQMKQNIMLAMPVHLALLQSGASGGHNVVADGYNTEDFYHLNFGWGGSYNGWYHVPEDIPYSLTIIEGAVMDIGAKQVGLPEEKQSIIASLNIVPNPCYKSTELTVCMRESSFVYIDLRALSGAGLTEVYQGHLAVGAHKFNLNNLTTKGVYVLTLRTNQGLYTKKILVR